MMVGTLASNEEVVRCWRVAAVICDGGRGCHIAAKDTRDDTVHRAYGHRFPAGWRSGDIDRLTVPKYVRASMKRMMNSLA